MSSSLQSNLCCVHWESFLIEMRRNRMKWLSFFYKKGFCARLRSWEEPTGIREIAHSITVSPKGISDTAQPQLGGFTNTWHLFSGWVGLAYVTIIFVSISTTEHLMVPAQMSDYMMDVIGHVERQQLDYSLCFRRVLWYQPLRLSNELYVSVIYHQVRRTAITGTSQHLTNGPLRDILSTDQPNQWTS